MINFFRKTRKRFADESEFLKYSRYAIGEIVLVVIGILIALQVNNWNEQRIEQRRIKKYAKSLIKDLENDITMIQVSMFQADKGYKRIDSLRSYMLLTAPKDLSNTLLYVLTHDIMYRPYKWNRSTFEELKNSGGLRYISNDSLEKLIVAYESFSQHLDEDFAGDKVNAEKANDLISSVLNLNSDYIAEMTQIEMDNFNSPMDLMFNAQAYRDAMAHDLELNTYDPNELRQFVNRFILIQDQYHIRGFLEMPEIIEDAREIISLLKKEYE